MFELSEVQIEISGLCNSLCSYCDWQDRTIGKQHMNTALALRLLDECKELGVTRVRLHGIGESTIHPDILKIIQYGESLGVPHSLSTNCHNLKGEIAEVISETKGLHFILAVPWVMNEKFVDRCVWNAIDFLSRNPKCHNIHLQMVMAESAHKYYERFVSAFLPFAEKLDNVFLHLKNPATWPTEKPNLGFIETGLREHPKVILGELATPFSVGKNCRTPESMLMVLASGDVAPCCVSGIDWKIGNVTDRTLKEVWDGEEMRRVRELWRSSDDSVPCGVCRKRTDCVSV